MPTQLFTPGVYIEELSLLPPSVAEVSTAIPAFVGYTETALDQKANKSLLLTPVKIYSLMEYEELFGKADPEDNGLTVTITDTYQGKDNKSRLIEARIKDEDRKDLSKFNLYYSLQLYFANGGGPCYIVSVGDLKKPIGKKDLIDGLNKLDSEGEPTLIVIPEAIALLDVDRKDLYEQALKQASSMKDRFVIMDVPTTEKVDSDMNNFRNNSPADDTQRRFGAAYYPYLDTTIDYRHTETLKLSHINLNAPENTPTIYDGVELSKLKEEPTKDKPNPVYDNSLYNQIINTLTQVPLRLPPSPAIAGVYARVDRERGVWKAPANVGIYGIVGPSVKVDNELQRTMNIDVSGKSINVIRSFPGQGTLVWGARTLDGNSNEWKYINVRRLFIMAEESIQKATNFAVFEPNTASTWLKVKAMIESYLFSLWQRGALAGSKPEQAYYVHVGLNITMTQDDILNGIMRVSVGMAAVRPAEFIVLTFSHKLQES